MRYWRSHIWDVYKYMTNYQSDKKETQPYGAGSVQRYYRWRGPKRTLFNTANSCLAAYNF